jgi:hypothetical protein
MLALLQALLHVGITYVVLVVGGTIPVLKPPSHGHLEYEKFIVRSNDSLKFNFPDGDAALLKIGISNDVRRRFGDRQAGCLRY